MSLAGGMRRKPPGYWSEYLNQKKFLDQLGKQLGFHNRDSWYSITGNHLKKNGGGVLLEMFGNSPFKLLQSVYAEHDWVSWKFDKVPNGAWDNIRTDSHDFLEWLSNKLKIRELDDWY